MTVLKAHFDGKVLIPDEPVNLPMDCALEVHVLPAQVKKNGVADKKPLMKLVEALQELPSNPEWPSDGAAQHDHYLYGHSKRP